jgi:hypothetical protein
VSGPKSSRRCAPGGTSTCSSRHKGNAMDGRMTIAAHRRGGTNDELVRAWLASGIDTRVLIPERALVEVSPGEVVLARLDVLDTLDGIEPGLDDADALVEMGARALNRARITSSTTSRHVPLPVKTTNWGQVLGTTPGSPGATQGG